MRILIISSSYPRHPDESINAGVLARDLALVYTAQGHDVDVMTPAKPGGIVFDQAITGHCIPWLWPSLTVSDLGRKPFLDGLRAITLMVLGASMTIWQGATRRPDRTVALWALPSGVFAWLLQLLFRVPYRVWTLGSDVWRAHDFPAGITLLRVVLKGSDGAFADGSALAQEAGRLTGVDVEFLPSIRSLPVVPNAEPAADVAFVGRLHPNKGPDLLVEAGAVLARLGISTAIYGDGDMRQQLQERIDKLGVGASVRLCGATSAEETARVLASCRVLAIPSRVESIPLILGDAIQAGTTVVVTDVGDMREIVTRYGLGLVVEKPDPQVLADALMAALEGNLPTRRQTAALEIFSLEAAAARLFDSDRSDR